MYLRKFFEAATVEAGGGDIQTQVQPSIASLMATQGTKVTHDSQAARPIVNTEIKEEPKAENGTVATTTTSNAEQANQESQPPKTDEPIIATQPIAEAKQEVIPTWQEVLKSQQPDNVLKELGYDDDKVKFTLNLKDIDPKMVTFLQKWENKEDVTAYLKELTTDYTKLSPEEVMRHQLRVEYSKASESALNSLYKQKVINAYSLDPDKLTEEETAEGKLLLEAESDKFRDKLIENQQNFLLPKPPEAKSPEPDVREQQAQQQIEAYKSAIDNDNYSKTAFANKQIVIGEGDDAFKMPIDPDHIKSLLTDSNKWMESQFDIIKNPDGSIKSATPKIETQLLTAAFAANPKKFLDDYAKHLKAIGGKAAIEPIDNAKPPETNAVASSAPAYKSAAEAMAKGGTRSSGG